MKQNRNPAVLTVGGLLSHSCPALYLLRVCRLQSTWGQRGLYKPPALRCLWLSLWTWRADSSCSRYCPAGHPPRSSEQQTSQQPQSALNLPPGGPPAGPRGQGAPRPSLFFSSPGPLPGDSAAGLKAQADLPGFDHPV